MLTATYLTKLTVGADGSVLPHVREEDGALLVWNDPAGAAFTFTTRLRVASGDVAEITAAELVSLLRLPIYRIARMEGLPTPLACVYTLSWESTGDGWVSLAIGLGRHCRPAGRDPAGFRMVDRQVRPGLHAPPKPPAVSTVAAPRRPNPSALLHSLLRKTQ